MGEDRGPAAVALWVVGEGRRSDCRAWSLKSDARATRGLVRRGAWRGVGQRVVADSTHHHLRRRVRGPQNIFPQRDECVVKLLHLQLERVNPIVFERTSHGGRVTSQRLCSHCWTEKNGA